MGKYSHQSHTNLKCQKSPFLCMCSSSSYPCGYCKCKHQGWGKGSMPPNRNLGSSWYQCSSQQGQDYKRHSKWPLSPETGFTRFSCMLCPKALCRHRLPAIYGRESCQPALWNYQLCNVAGSQHRQDLV